MQAQGMFCTYHLKQREKPNLATIVLYFPTVLPTPAEVLQKTTRPDNGPTTPGRKPGGSSAEAAETTPGGTGAKWRKLVATKTAPTARKEKL